MVRIRRAVALDPLANAMYTYTVIASLIPGLTQVNLGTRLPNRYRAQMEQLVVHVVSSK